MATVITGTIDNDQAFITRAGNIGSDREITSINLGDDGLLQGPNVTSGSTGIADTQVLSRDSDNSLGDQGLEQRSINFNLTHTWETIPDVSGLQIDGIPINGRNQTSVTYDTDEAANDGFGDTGEWYYRRSNTDNSQDYDEATG